MLKNFALSIISGTLLFLCWPPKASFTILIFSSLVPVLFISQQFTFKNLSFLKFFGFTYLSFFTFNFLTTYWINFAHFGGAVFAILCNSLFMTLLILVYSVIKRNLQSISDYVLLPSIWISFEYLHLNWDLSWPWLNLGNVFSARVDWIQWYTFTGTLGGTFWILILNLMIFNFFNFLSQKISQNSHLGSSKMNLIAENKFHFFKFFSMIFIIFFVPLIISKKIEKDFLFHNFESTIKKKINVLVVQPNIDPYEEKFTTPQFNQTSKVLDEINDKIKDDTDYVLLPETFLANPIWQHNFKNNLDIKRFFKFINQKKQLNYKDSTYNFPHHFIIGSTTLKLSSASYSSKPVKNNPGNYYKVHNSALQLCVESKKNNFELINIYNKSKLVPGAEQLPFHKYLHKFFGDKILQIGSSTSLGNFSKQDSVNIFENSNRTLSVAPIICYESIYGDYVRKFINMGAGVIFIITNDGWWKNTSGYKQHHSYAKLRAIENRRYVARSANTGISSVIDCFGNVVNYLDWDIFGVIDSNLPILDYETFYTKHGDFLGRIASFFFAIILLNFLINNKLRNST